MELFVRRKLQVLILATLLSHYSCEEYTTIRPMQPRTSATMYIENLSTEVSLFVVTAMHRFRTTEDRFAKFMVISPGSTAGPFTMWNERDTGRHSYKIEFGVIGDDRIYGVENWLTCDFLEGQNTAKMQISYEGRQITMKTGRECSNPFVPILGKRLGRLRMKNICPHHDVLVKGMSYNNDTIVTDMRVPADTEMPPSHVVVPSPPHWFNIICEDPMMPTPCTTGEFQCDMDGEDMRVHIDIKNSMVIMRRRTQRDCMRRLRCPHSTPKFWGTDVISPEIIAANMMGRRDDWTRREDEERPSRNDIMHFDVIRHHHPMDMW